MRLIERAVEPDYLARTGECVKLEPYVAVTLSPFTSGSQHFTIPVSLLS